MQQPPAVDEQTVAFAKECCALRLLPEQLWGRCRYGQAP